MKSLVSNLLDGFHPQAGFLFLCSVIAAFFLSSSSYARQWSKIQVHFSTSDTAFNYWEGSFVSKTTGWYVTGLQPSRIFKTTDGGHNWLLKAVSGGQLFQLFALDSLRMWVRNNEHSLKFTSDGGDSWDSTTVDSAAYTSVGPIHFFSASDGYLFGSRLFHSVDGGKTWSIFNDQDTLISINATRVDFVDKDFGVTAGWHPIATDAGAFGRTTDGGVVWQFQQQPAFTYPLNGLDFIDSLNGFAVGYNAFGGNTGMFYTTHDGGINWTGQALSAMGSYPDVAFINRDTGWITGSGGTIWKTTDGGTSWNIQSTGVSVALKKICVFPNQGLAYVFGDSNTILYSDIVADAALPPLNLPVTFSLSQNYPNPFNPATQISYALASSVHVTLKVFDLLGRTVATLIDGVQSAGNRSVRFDASNLAGGIYFYRLQAGSFVSVKKMVLAK